jgi:sigma-B regulation protein RsbU (phosphoserine phosphatase)
MEDTMLQTFFTSDLLSGHGNQQQKLDFVVEMMRDLSRQTDPQIMVANYGARMRQVVPSDANFSLSRRELEAPYFRITRSSRWEAGVNPWKHKERLPVFKGGVIARIIYGDLPVVIDDLEAELCADDPAIEYLQGFKSLTAIPLYDQGVAMNMVVLLRREADAFERERLPEHVWMSNLFGRATHSLVLSDEVKRAYDVVDRELKVVADIQRSLLPTTLPEIPSLELACHYQTSTRAGGDYYDFFELPDGKWGILIADVSGHGTPAAVIMAVTHSIAHMLSEPPLPPSRLMNFVNEHLTRRYTNGSGTFVTAFYGIYDPADRTLSYASAGHPPARLLHCDRIQTLDGYRSLPLGIDANETYEDNLHQLEVGDTLILYTDGITEARNPEGAMFGEDRLDQAAICRGSAPTTLTSILAELDRFRAGRTLGDDRTLLVARITEGPDDKGCGI